MYIHYYFSKMNQVKYVTFNLVISLILLEISWSFIALKRMNSFSLKYSKAFTGSFFILKGNL